MAKINISIDDRLLSRADNFADDNYTSRSGLITLALSQYLNQQELFTAVKEINLTIKKVAETSTMDEESKKQLDNFEKLCSLLIP